MTVMTIQCCVCHEIMGTKDGKGQTGVTSGVHEECALTLLPVELHSEYRKLMAAYRERPAVPVDLNRVAMGRCF